MAVVDEGFGAARVLVLAQRLDVTRGSFYWHFSDHNELIQALVTRWQDGEREAVQRLYADQTDAPQADLERLLDAALAHAGAHFENLRFELALRDLGRRNAAVLAMLAEVDQVRMALFTHKFKRLVGDEVVASELAALFYIAVSGSGQALSRPNGPPHARAFLSGVIRRYVIGWPVQEGVGNAA